MEEKHIKQLWSDYEAKLEKSLALNHKIMKEIQTQKTEGRLRAFFRNQLWGLVLGTLWIVFLLFLIMNTLDNIYFVVSVGIILLFNVFATVSYIKHMVMLKEVDLSGSITDSQKKITKIQLSFTNVGRILVLQTPFYCTFWYNDKLIENAGMGFWLIQLIIVALFTVGALFVYRNLTRKNMHKKWVKVIMQSFGGKTLIKARDFLGQLEDYESESSDSLKSV